MLIKKVSAVELKCTLAGRYNFADFVQLYKLNRKLTGITKKTMRLHNEFKIAGLAKIGSKTFARKINRL